MKRLFCDFLSDCQAQEFIEYTLLLSVICLISAAMYINSGENIEVIWRVTSNNLNSAVSAIS